MSQHLHFPQQDRYPPFNTNDLPPESPDLINMSGLGRPSGVGMQGFAQYAPLPTQGRVTGELMGGMQTFGTGHDQQTFAQGQGLYPMMEYIHNRDEPWNPLDVEKRLFAGVSPSHPLSNFHGFRMPPPSEADTVSQSVGGVPSDSGYGSMARQSVGNPSVCGDMDQTLISRLQAMGKENVSSTTEPRKREARGQRPTLGTPSTKGIICPTCDTLLKTNSELKKHQARHDKPFKCNFPGCTKAIKGFGTNNDLDRHKRCVHKLLSGDEPVYRCDVGQCKDKPKDWPRQDNFRQHLKRKHNFENVDLNRFMFRPSGSAGLARFAPSEASLPEEAVSTVSVPWTRLDHSHVSPASLMGGDHRFAEGVNVVPYHDQAPMRERDAAHSEAAASQHLCQNNEGNARLHLNMAPELSGFEMSRSSTQGTNASVAEEYSGLDQPTCVAPNVLSHARMETNSFRHMNNQPQPMEVVAHPEVDDSPGEFPEDAQSEVEEIESAISDEMDVDDAAQDSASEDGHHNTDVEDDEPSDGNIDTQSIILRNAGAQYSKADEAHIRTYPSPSPVQLGADAPQPIELDEETYASAVIQSLIEKGKLAEILKKVGYSALEEAETKQQKRSGTSSAASENGHVNKCPVCTKTFQRRCELKKHQKRHAKPYACTFAKCDKKFGSKNDWKRHENSQHFQLEIWRCAEKVADRPEQPECGKVCHRRESLKSHLERDHHLRDHAVLDKKLADCRMGRNFESRFWCGFCQKTIEPTGKGGPAHSERFDHIDDHFIGREMPKADIKDWKHVDTDPVDSPDSSPGKGGRDGMLGKGRAGRVVVGRSSNPLKRVHGEVGDGGAPRAKRLKDGNGKLFFWICCNCGHCWRMGSTPQCMDGCDHAHCDDCRVFDEDDSVQEPEPEVPAQSQVQMDGLMT